MRLALIGYGKMGKEIERLAVERGWRADVHLDIALPPATPEQRKAVDVAIHFAQAKTIIDDLSPWAEAQTPIVVGTTGWQDRLQDVEALVKKNRTGLVYASNFSLGVNIYFQLVRAAARLVDRFDEYDASIQEVHHKNKIDSPSGTALTMGQILLKHIGRKKELLSETSHGAIRPDQLHISSTRTGAVVGIHSVTLDSPADTIEVKHTAKNREGMARGALLAAEWIMGKKGIFTMDDLFQDLFK